MNVGINGFGRIGRLFMRAVLYDKNLPFKVTHINDLADPKCLTELMERDSAHGILGRKVFIEGNKLMIEGYTPITFSQTRKPEEIPWDQSNVELVLESTGVFCSREGAGLHLKKGVKKVIISAPPKGEIDRTIVIGANEEQLQASDVIISNASCTTNSITAVLKVIKDNFGIKKGLLTTVHGYTMDQRLQDAPHEDMRRARAAGVNVIPTSTGAAKLAGKIIDLAGKIDGMALRVPVITGSLTQVSLDLEKPTNAEEVNLLLKKACENELKGIVHYTDQAIVSGDIIGDPRSGIIDSQITKVQNDDLLQLNVWYDNEWGYSNRTVDLVAYIAEGKFGQKHVNREVVRSSGMGVGENY